jgi:site-specific DNA-cytosine methylase
VLGTPDHDALTNHSTTPVEHWSRFMRQVPASQPDTDYLPAPNSLSVLGAQFAKLSGSDKLRLREGLAELASITDGKFALGTGCSGTDLIVAAVQDTLAFWNKMYGEEMDVDHKFSCESLPFKQRFIERIFAPPHLFPELKELANRSAVDTNGIDAIIDNILLWACGVECDSISGLNQARVDNFDCIGAAEGDKESRTGGTGKSCMDFVHVHRPPVFLLENVKNLQVAGKSGKSNLFILIGLANTSGYILLDLLLNSLNFGMPQQRERFYMIGILVSDAPINQQDPKFLPPTWVREFVHMVAAMTVPIMEMRHFLLDDDDPQVVKANKAKVTSMPTKTMSRSATAKSKAKAKAKANASSVDVGDTEKIAEYELDHLEAYYKAGIQWPPVFDPAFLKKTGCLTLRQQQSLWWVENTQGPACTARCLMVRDLNMSATWQVDREDFTPCIVSSSTLWIRGPRNMLIPEEGFVDRCMAGSELLALQGLDFDRMEIDEDEFSHQQLTDLAGNAFCAAVLYPIFTALVACAPLAEAIRIAKGQHSRAIEEVAAEGTPVADEGEDDSASDAGDEENGESEEQDHDSIMSTDSEAVND